MRLLNSQKNDLYDLIEKYGLSPSQFEFKNIESFQSSPDIATELCYKSTDFFFRFDTHNESHYATFSPGEEKILDDYYTRDWYTQCLYFGYWLEYLIREINTPNKWDRLDKEMQSIRFNFKNEEDKFSFNEYEDLKEKVEILKNSINQIGLLAEQVITINAKLDHLVDLAKEMNKFDWKSLFVGTVISMIIQLGVTQENAKALWAVIKQIFNNYLLP